MTVVDGRHQQFVDLPGRRSKDPLDGVDSASSLRIVELERTEGRTAHLHPHSEEVIYVEAGSGQVWIDGTHHRVRQGDVIHIPAGAPHATVPDEEVQMSLICFFPHPELNDNIENSDISVT